MRYVDASRALSMQLSHYVHTLSTVLLESFQNQKFKIL